MGPINYYSMTSPIQIGDGLKSGYNEAIARQQAEAIAREQMAAKQREEAARQRYEAALNAALQNPSAQNYAALTLLNPKEHEGIQAAWGALDKDQQAVDLQDLSAVRGYLRAGQPDKAKTLLQRRIDADKAAGQDTADDEQVVALIGQDPDGAAGYVDYVLAGVMGPEKWSATFEAVDKGRREDAQLPGAIAKTTAEVGKLKAETGQVITETGQIVPNAEAERGLKAAQAQRLADQTRLEADRLALDADELETKTALEIEKLQLTGVPLSAGGEKQVFDSVTAAESSRQLANRANSLADRIETGGQGLGGGFASLKEAGAGLFGKQDAVSALRKEYTAIMSSQAVKNLPPGPASDKDIQLALKGFPPATANAETLASFLRGMAKLQGVAANREQARADWISSNGNLGTAKRDLTVNGVKVPAGSTFADFSNSQAAVERREAAGERSYMRFAQ